jgi:lysophospholipase L1-like esterase
MLVAPPVIDETASYKIFKDLFKGSESASRKLPKLIEKYAKSNDLLFFDASKIVKVSKVDGIHLDEDANKILGESLAEKITSVI